MRTPTRTSFAWRNGSRAYSGSSATRRFVSRADTPPRRDTPTASNATSRPSAADAWAATQSRFRSSHRLTFASANPRTPATTTTATAPTTAHFRMTPGDRSRRRLSSESAEEGPHLLDLHELQHRGRRAGPPGLEPDGRIARGRALVDAPAGQRVDNRPPPFAIGGERRPLVPDHATVHDAVRALLLHPEEYPARDRAQHDGHRRLDVPADGERVEVRAPLRHDLAVAEPLHERRPVVGERRERRDCHPSPVEEVEERGTADVMAVKKLVVAEEDRRARIDRVDEAVLHENGLARRAALAKPARDAREIRPRVRRI